MSTPGLQIPDFSQRTYRRKTPMFRLPLGRGRHRQLPSRRGRGHRGRIHVGKQRRSVGASASRTRSSAQTAHPISSQASCSLLFHRRLQFHCNWLQRHSIVRKARPRVRLNSVFFFLPSFNYVDVFVLMIKIHLSILFFPLQMQVISSAKQHRNMTLSKV